MTIYNGAGMLRTGDTDGAVAYRLETRIIGYRRDG